MGYTNFEILNNNEDILQTNKEKLETKASIFNNNDYILQTKSQNESSKTTQSLKDNKEKLETEAQTYSAECVQLENESDMTYIQRKKGRYMEYLKVNEFKYISKPDWAARRKSKELWKEVTIPLPVHMHMINNIAEQDRDEFLIETNKELAYKFLPIEFEIPQISLNQNTIDINSTEEDIFPIGFEIPQISLIQNTIDINTTEEDIFQIVSNLSKDELLDDLDSNLPQTIGSL